MNAVMKRFALTGKVAMVTGASRGLGKAIAIGLADAGADVVVVGVPHQVGALVAMPAELGQQRHAEVAHPRHLLGCGTRRDGERALPQPSTRHWILT